jgi:hypothetical protein
MAKRLSKSESKRLYAAILSKAKRLWGTPTLASGGSMSTSDLVAIEKIIHKYQKRD